MPELLSLHVDVFNINWVRLNFKEMGFYVCCIGQTLNLLMQRPTSPVGIEVQQGWAVYVSGFLK